MIPAPQRAIAPDRIPPSTLRISVGTPLARPPALPFLALQLLLRLRSGATVGGDHRLRRSRILSTETTGRATLRRTPNAILRVDSSPSCVGRPGGSLPPLSLPRSRPNGSLASHRPLRRRPLRRPARCVGVRVPQNAKRSCQVAGVLRAPTADTRLATLAATQEKQPLPGLQHFEVWDGCSTSRPPLPGDMTIRLKDTGNRRPGGRRRPGSYGVSALTPGPVEVGLLD